LEKSTEMKAEKEKSKEENLGMNIAQ